MEPTMTYPVTGGLHTTYSIGRRKYVELKEITTTTSSTQLPSAYHFNPSSIFTAASATPPLRRR
jgi:hypothetical protein